MALKDEFQLVPKGLTSLRPEDREFLVAKLVEILVMDYEANQAGSSPMVKAGGGVGHGMGSRKDMKSTS